MGIGTGELAKIGRFEVEGGNMTFLNNPMEVACGANIDLLVRDMCKRASDPLQAFKSREIGKVSSALTNEDAGVVGR